MWGGCRGFAFAFFGSQRRHAIRTLPKRTHFTSFFLSQALCATPTDYGCYHVCLTLPYGNNRAVPLLAPLSWKVDASTNITDTAVVGNLHLVLPEPLVHQAINF